MNRNRLRIRTCCLAATIMLAGSGSMAVNAAPAAGLSDELSTTISSVTKESTVAGGTLTFAKAVSDSQKADENKENTDNSSEDKSEKAENETPVVKSEYADIAIAQVDNYVNVRSTPGEDGEVLGKLYDKSAATVEGEENGWYKITSGSVTGYVKKEFVVVGNEELARAVGRSSVAELLPLLSTLVLSYILCAVQSFGVEGLLVKFVAKLSPIKFFKGIAPAQYVAFTTQSSVGTIPVTLRQLKEALGVDADVASFTAGLGANVGMPACAGIWPALTAVFSVHMLGYHYGIAQYAFLILITLVVSVGTVGVPGTATITSTAVFAALGLPIELVVVFAPISTIVDMARTMTNVTGAATAAVITAATEGLVDEEVYNSDKSKHVAVNN